MLAFLMVIPARAQSPVCGYNDPRQAEKVLSSVAKVDKKALTGALCTQSSLQGEDYSPSPLAYGARKLFATMYGCAINQDHFYDRQETGLTTKIAQTRPGTPDNPRYFVKTSHYEVVRLHPYLRDQVEKCSLVQDCSKYSSITEPVNCAQTRCFFYLYPPIYQITNPAELFYRHDRGKPFASGTDCSQAVVQSMKAAGLLMMPKTAVPRLSTGSIRDFLDTGRSCFKHVDMLDDFRPGDVFNHSATPTGHVVMINTVAKDPFGINELIAQVGKDNDLDSYRDKPAADKDAFAKRECALIESDEWTRKYRISLIQSSPQGNHDVGLQGTKINPGLYGELMSKMKTKAKIACVAAFYRQWDGGELKKKLYKRVVTTSSIKTKRGNRMKTTQVSFEPCTQAGKSCVERYESAFLNEQPKLIKGATAHVRHKLTPECLETSLKDPAKAKFDPYSCADTCDLDVKYQQLEAGQ